MMIQSTSGGCLWEVVAYESLDHNGSHISLIRMLYMYVNCRDPCANAEAVFSKSQLKVNFDKKNLFLPIEKFPFLVLARDNVTTLFYPFFAPLSVKWLFTEG